MKKKLLFLYPIKEYMQILNTDNTIEIMKETIDERYRKKGYEINYLVFPDKPVWQLDVHDDDKIITTDITFAEHIKPVENNEENNSYNYPNNEKIEADLGEVDQLIICGFHAQDCVKKVAKYFLEKEIDVLVDLELTDFFRVYQQFVGFDKATYNLANIMQNLKAQDIFYGFSARINGHNVDEMYQEAYYQKAAFNPTISVQKIIDELVEHEQSRQKTK